MSFTLDPEVAEALAPFTPPAGSPAPPPVRVFGSGLE
jgi:hypothetical protein